MLRYVLVFLAGMAFTLGALSFAWLDWVAVLSFTAASGLCLFAAVGATAPRGEEIPGKGRHLRSVRTGRAP
jgi:hypothetical protein